MRMLRDLLLDDSGLAALEWALVGPLFFLLLLATVELGLVLGTQATMDGATRDAVRLMRNGAFSAAPDPRTAFQNVLCGEMSVFANAASCQADMVVAAVSTDRLAPLSFPPCAAGSAPPSAQACPFETGNPGDLVGVQVTYNRPFLIPWVGSVLSAASDAQHVKLVSTVVYRNGA
ncbi:MAG TPA: TadE/TadG family type IV pilus assembly protein [Stellaceae bacterium]